MYFGDTPACYNLETVHLGGSIPTQTVCASDAGGRAGPDGDASQTFPQCVPAATALVECVAGNGQARAEASCEAGLPLS